MPSKSNIWRVRVIINGKIQYFDRKNKGHADQIFSKYWERGAPVSMYPLKAEA